MIRYSVIIPHFNTPDLLDRLLSTIPERADLQTIVIDDCSESKSFGKLVAKYPGAEFHTVSHHGGPGPARNYGLDLAEGDYILFADSDDFFNPCFNDVLDEYSDMVCDVVYFNANSVNSSTYMASTRSEDRNAAFRACVHDKCDPSPTPLFRNNGERFRFGFTTPWGKLISRALIDRHNIRFGDARISEDIMFSTMVDLYARSVWADTRCIYCLTSSGSSLSFSTDTGLVLEKVMRECERYKFMVGNGLGERTNTAVIGEGLCTVYFTGDKGAFKKALGYCQESGMSKYAALRLFGIQYARYGFMRALALLVPDRVWRILSNAYVSSNY